MKGGMGSIPGRGAKMLHATWHNKKKKKEKKKLIKKNNNLEKKQKTNLKKNSQKGDSSLNSITIG